MENNTQKKQVNQIVEPKNINSASYLLIAIPSIISFFVDKIFDVLPNFSNIIYNFYNTNTNMYITLTSAISFFAFLLISIACSFIYKENKKKIYFILAAILGNIINSILLSLLNWLAPQLIIKNILNTTTYAFFLLLIEIIGAIISIILAIIIFIGLNNIDKNKKETTDTAQSTPQIVYNEKGEAIQINATADTKSSRSRAVTALLCFFLGTLGIHRLYAGKIGTGLLWMFTAGLCGIGSFIDFIIIICGGFKDADGKTI